MGNKIVKAKPNTEQGYVNTQTSWTTDIIETRRNESSNAEKCLVLIEITEAASVDILMSLDIGAPFAKWGFTITETSIVEVPLAKYFDFFVNSNTGAVNIWMQEIE